jgi:hypothetical protein
LNQTFGNDKQTIDKIKKFYDDNKPFFRKTLFRKKHTSDKNKKPFFRNKTPTSVKQSGGTRKKSRTNKRKKSK